MIEVIRRLLVAGLTIGVIAGNADEITRFYDETVAHAQHLATSADLRSISNMLDYELLKRGRYPRSRDFENWLKRTFKENPAGELGRDHWGHPLIYQADHDRKGFSLTSKGPDGLAGTADDLLVTGP
jgi:general secretion pathway protein G